MFYKYKRVVRNAMNIRIRLKQLCGSIRELGEKPMKEIDKAGIDTIKVNLEGVVITKNEYYNPDPSGIRTGNRPGPSYVKTFENVILNSENVLQKVGDA